MDKENLQARYGCVFVIIILVVYGNSIFPIRNESWIGILGLFFFPIVIPMAYSIGMIIGNIHNYYSTSERINDKPKNINISKKVELIEKTENIELLEKVNKINFSEEKKDNSVELSRQLTHKPYIKKCDWCNKVIVDNIKSDIDGNFCCDQCYYDWHSCYDSDD